MKKPFERGIYLLPNLMTTAALFAGFYAVIAGMQGHYEQGAIAIFVAMVFDGLDGRVARMTNSSSAFGAEYDSLADMVSFGLAPALLVYTWVLQDFGKLGWLAAFIYTAGAALRLARFNTQVGVADKRYFQGLPSPAAAALLAGLIWMVENDGLQNDLLPLITLVLTIFAGLMMVSNIRFSSFKELNLKNKVSFLTLILGVLVLVVISINPALILFSILFLYALSGPVVTLTSLRKTRELRRQQREQSENVESSSTNTEAVVENSKTVDDTKKSDS